MVISQPVVLHCKKAYEGWRIPKKMRLIAWRISQPIDAS